MQDTFNLLDEKWIPVLRTNGRPGRVGIREAFVEAGSIRQIAASNPMDRVALLRFLLAVLYWCKGNPPDGDEMSRILAEGQFPAAWFDKLDGQRDCFNLLGAGKRFYQDRDARRERPSTDLLQEVPTGNNFWHFRHSTDRIDGLCPACCALGLLRLPLFSVSGLPDLKSGINGTPPIYVLPVGPSLLHTLCLNWVPCSSLASPSWEQPDARPQDGQPVPLLPGLTMLSRRVWLHDPGPPRGVCIACGRQQPSLVLACEFQSAGDQENEHWVDPHVVYVEKKAGRKALTTPDLTKSFFRMDKPWIPLFIGISSSPTSHPYRNAGRLLIVGFATDKAKNIDVWERTCVLPNPGTTATQAAGPAESLSIWQDEGGKLFVRLKPRGSKARGGEFAIAVTAIRPHVETRVSAHVAELLAQPDSAWPQAVDEYRRMLPVIAKSLAPGSTTRSVQRRNQIANALPDMTAKPAAKAGKPKAAKGGGK